MTVSELLEHYGFYPSSIWYYDRDANEKDVVYIKRSVDDYDDELYDKFIKEYGDRFVSDLFMNSEYDLRIVIE